MRVLLLFLIIAGLAYGGYWLITDEAAPPPAPEAPKAKGTPREVYCRIPVARTSGGAAKLHTNYDECMKTSNLPLMKEFTPQQQDTYKRMGIVPGR